jgi:hypothetical protein
MHEPLAQVSVSKPTALTTIGTATNQKIRSKINESNRLQLRLTTRYRFFQCSLDSNIANKKIDVCKEIEKNC